MLEAGYILLFITLLSTILIVYNKAMVKNKFTKKRRSKNILIIIGVISLWFLIHYMILQTDFYKPTDIPRIPLLMILPLFIFTAIFLYKNRNSVILHSVPKHIPIFYQSFRAVIEVLFWLTFLKGYLPVHVTFEGYNYDVLLGISALLAGGYTLRKNASNKVLIAWNMIGILVVGWAAFIFNTTNYFPQIWGFEQSIFSQEFLRFPFVLLPLFLMPSAIFFHVFSIFQLTKKD